MRILIGTWHRNLVGGTEKYLQALIPGLLEQGHQVAVVHACPANIEEGTIDPPGAPVPVWSLAELGSEALLRAVAEWEPDVVYSQGVNDTALELALLDRYPTILFAHAYNLTCVSGRKYHAFPGVQPCNRKFGPACLALYFPRRCGGWSPQTMWLMYQETARVNARLNTYRAVVVGSAHMYHEFLQHGVPPEKLHVAPLPSMDSEFRPDPPKPHAPEGRILFLGRLIDAKGGSYLIRAIPQASKKLGRPLSLTIAGDGPDRQPLEKLSRDLHVTVKFAGWLSAQPKAALLRESDLLAVPSLWPEPFGLVGIEAGSLGVPAVGYALGGIPDWLIPGETGELAPGDPPTVDGLADAIVAALADPVQYQRLCRGAWEKSHSFTLAAHMNKLEAILGDALPRNDSASTVPEVLRS